MPGGASWRDESADSPRFVELQMSDSSATPLEASDAAQLRVVIGQAKIEVAPGFDAATLSRPVQALRESGAC